MFIKIMGKCPETKEQLYCDQCGIPCVQSELSHIEMIYPSCKQVMLMCTNCISEYDLNDQLIK